MEINDIVMQKSLGTWKPNHYLSNLALSYFEEAQFAHKRVFPICPVQLPSGHFYEFSKEDLARSNVHVKPPYGAVQPAVFGLNEQSYSCLVYQIMIGLDKIMTLPYQRAGAAFDPMRLRTKTISEQIAQKQELDFASKFFKSGVWANEWTGAASDNEANKQFKRLDNSNVDPVAFFDKHAIEIRREGRRRPNKLVLGVKAYSAIRNNPFVKERVKYSGTTQNPAVINEQVLAQMLGVEQVIVLDATFNAADLGHSADMQYICSPKDALLLYAPATPQIDEPSAGEIFCWNLNGNDYIAITQTEGAPGTHTDFLEGIIAYDMKKTSDALAIFFKDCVG